MKNYEDKIYSLGETVTGQTQAMSQVVQKTLESNGGVGIMTGSYDQNLSILSVDNLLLHSTGYTFDTFMEQTKGSLRNFFYDEEDSSVAHLAPIHDIGKIKVPIEILNKNGKLTDEEMNVVKQHPLVGAAMTQRFPEGITTEKLNKYSYEICRHHHERYDGSGYPDGLKGNAIPMCAQVVGIVDAYDALINDRPYKRKYEPEEAIRMISNGECGAFSNQLMQCFQEAAKQQNWLKRQN